MFFRCGTPLIAIGVFFAAAHWSLAQSGPLSEKEVTERARKEGEVVFYTSLGAGSSQPLASLFEKRFPFLKARVFRLGNEKLLSKVMTEARAGRHTVDVVLMNILNLRLLQKAGLLAPYNSRESAAIPEPLKDPQGHWTAVYSRLWVIGFHTGMVPAKDAPRDWMELMQPKWKGKIGMDPEETEWYIALVGYWGKEKTQRFFRQLMSQNPSLRRGHTLLAQLTAAGEFPLSIAYAHNVEQMKHAGAPMDWVAESDPITVSPSVVALAAHAPHPHAARLLIDHVLSKEGQSLLSGDYRVAARQDVTPLSPKLVLSRLKGAYVKPEFADDFVRLQKEYHDIVGR